MFSINNYAIEIMHHIPLIFDLNFRMGLALLKQKNINNVYTVMYSNNVQTNN